MNVDAQVDTVFNSPTIPDCLYQSHRMLWYTMHIMCLEYAICCTCVIHTYKIKQSNEEQINKVVALNK